MKMVRWGILGCGDVTEVKSGPGFQKANGSQLIAVMRRDPTLAKDYAQRHGVPRWYSDPQALIDDPQVEAVYIATPPHMHHPYTLAAARAGKPVYVEKPMALNTAECREMVYACRLAGVPLFVAYYRRALPRFQKIKELVDSGAIGQVRSVHIELTQPLHSPQGELPWRLRPETAGGGLFVDLASHTLDFLDYLLGPIGHTSGFARNQAGAYSAEDILGAAFEFESGVVGAGLWCFNSFSTTDCVTLTGSEGRIRFATFAHDPVTLETTAGFQTFDIPHPPHIQQPMIQQVVDELLGRGRCLSTGESGLRTTRVMEQLLQEYYSSKSTSENSFDS